MLHSYEKIFRRVCGEGKTVSQRKAVRLLQWMIVARRPLKKPELESGIVLDEDVQQISNETRIRGDVLSLCSPLLELESGPGGSVNFVHFTAKESVPCPLFRRITRSANFLPDTFSTLATPQYYMFLEPTILWLSPAFFILFRALRSSIFAYQRAM